MPGTDLIPYDPTKLAEDEAKVRGGFWHKLKRVVAKIPFAEDLLAAYYCAIDPQTPTRTRGILLAALAYFVLPIDIIPDMLAVVGFSDDVAVLTAAFAAISGQIKETHYTKADETLADTPQD